jgi:hypothetical protein
MMRRLPSTTFALAKRAPTSTLLFLQCERDAP